jgi:hypothetical protein
MFVQAKTLLRMPLCADVLVASGNGMAWWLVRSEPEIDANAIVGANGAFRGTIAMGVSDILLVKLEKSTPKRGTSAKSAEWRDAEENYDGRRWNRQAGIVQVRSAVAWPSVPLAFEQDSGGLQVTLPKDASHA